MKKVACSTNRDGVALFYEDGRRTFAYYEQTHTPSEDLRTETFDEPSYTKEQNAAYRVAVYGIAGLSQSERKSVSKEKARYIRRNFKKARKEIFCLKNEVLEKILLEKLPTLFGPRIEKSQVLKNFLSQSESFHTFPNRLSFEFLGIDKSMIINRLVKAGILDPSLFGF